MCEPKRLTSLDPEEDEGFKIHKLMLITVGAEGTGFLRCSLRRAWKDKKDEDSGWELRIIVMLIVICF